MTNNRQNGRTDNDGHHLSMQDKLLTQRTDHLSMQDKLPMIGDKTMNDGQDRQTIRQKEQDHLDRQDKLSATKNRTA